jgi:hypothetical protein
MGSKKSTPTKPNTPTSQSTSSSCQRNLFAVSDMHIACSDRGLCEEEKLEVEEERGIYTLL